MKGIGATLILTALLGLGVAVGAGEPQIHVPAPAPGDLPAEGVATGEAAEGEVDRSPIDLPTKPHVQIVTSGAALELPPDAVIGWTVVSSVADHPEVSATGRSMIDVAMALSGGGVVDSYTEDGALGLHQFTATLTSGDELALSTQDLSAVDRPGRFLTPDWKLTTIGGMEGAWTTDDESFVSVAVVTETAQLVAHLHSGVRSDLSVEIDEGLDLLSEIVSAVAP